MSPGVVATSRSERGEVVLRRRGSDDALELRVNGVFVMDDRETTTERLLGRTSLDALAGTSPAQRQWRVLLGGLGLGFTLAAVLAEPRVASVLVAEIEADLVGWHRSGLVPGSRIGDDRVSVTVGDVQQVVAAQPGGSVDLIVLDVDNGPDFLVYDDNAEVYRPPFLLSCREALTPDGLVAVWSADAAPTLVSALDSVFGSPVQHSIPVTLGTRPTTYHLLLAPHPR